MGTRTLLRTDPDGTQHYEMKNDAGDIVGYGTIAAAPSVTDQIEDQARQALATLRAYRDLASPTAAQTTAAVKLLCRCMIIIIRRMLNQLDGTD
jgi:hypothetical protein